MLVLRLTELDLCKLESRGPPLPCTLGLWPSRERVMIGILSLPVKSPRVWENLDILRRWDLMVPFEATSRRQLTIMSPRLPARPR